MNANARLKRSADVSVSDQPGTLQNVNAARVEIGLNAAIVAVKADYAPGSLNKPALIWAMSSSFTRLPIAVATPNPVMRAPTSFPLDIWPWETRQMCRS